jgi:O-antigen ligase
LTSEQPVVSAKRAPADGGAALPGWTARLKTERRLQIALGAVAVGLILSALAVAAGVSPGSALVPFALGACVAFLITPFPEADYLLAFGTLLSIPLLPSSSLPNLPLGLAAVGFAAIRLVPSVRRIPRTALVLLALIWLPLAIGMALSAWPAASMWLRPVVILGAGAAMTVVGAAVATDRERLVRWLMGWTAACLVVASTAGLVFLLQLAVPVTAIADGVTSLLGYLRGDGAAKAFGALNNWVIAGPDTLTLRAVSPFMPSPNNVGGYLGTLGPLALVTWLAATSTSRRRLAAAAIGATTFTVVTTFSRSTWVGAAALAVVCALFIARPSIRREVWWPDRRLLTRLAAIAVAPAIVAVMLMVVVGQPATSVRIEQPLEDPSVQQRIEIDRGAVEAITNSPFRGFGLGNWEATLGTQTGVAYVHNVYLEYAAAVGLFGAVWVVAMLLGIVVPGVWLQFRGPSGSRLVGLALLAVGAFTTAQFLFDDNLLNPQYVWALMFVLGVSVALPHVRAMASIGAGAEAS